MFSQTYSGWGCLRLCGLCSPTISYPSPPRVCAVFFLLYFTSFTIFSFALLSWGIIFKLVWPVPPVLGTRVEMELWRHCARWLIDCRVLPPNHRVTLDSAQVCDLAQALRDGVLLCQLLNNLMPHSVNLGEINVRPQMSQVWTSVILSHYVTFVYLWYIRNTSVCYLQYPLCLMIYYGYYYLLDHHLCLLSVCRL